MDDLYTSLQRIKIYQESITNINHMPHMVKFHEERYWQKVMSLFCVHSAHSCKANKSRNSKPFLRMEDHGLLTVLIKKIIKEDKS